MALSITLSEWENHVKKNFLVNGRESFVVCPEKPLEGNPWIWRAEFFGAFAQADKALLEQGWHLAYHKVSDLYGCPSAIQWMHEFRETAVKELELSQKAVLFGFSRGGLYACNYALTYPAEVSALYLDAPVLNIRSWPGGKGTGCGAEREWQECLSCYGLTEKTAASFAENPLDRTEELAKTGIPVLLVAGGSDAVVPYSENGALFAERFRKAGGFLQEFVKPDCGHHPHSLEDPTPIVQFVSIYGK